MHRWAHTKTKRQRKVETEGDSFPSKQSGPCAPFSSFQNELQLGGMNWYEKTTISCCL